MATSVAPGMRIATTKPSVYSSCNVSKPGTTIFGTEIKRTSWTRLNCSSHISSTQSFSHSFQFTPVKLQRLVPKALSEGSSDKPVSGLPIDLRGKRAFIAGVADDNGYGWAIAKSLAAAGAEILVGTWVPALNIFENSLRRGKFDESRTLPDGSLMEITKVYPLDAVYDSPEDVPEDVKTNKRYSGSSNWTVKEVAESVKQDFGSIDILVHSLANGPEVSKSLLETSRNGYLAAISASSYSFVSLLKHFVPIMNPGTFLFQVDFSPFCLHCFKVMVKLSCDTITGGATISLTYIASERIIPGYGGGMSSAKAALESDTKVLAFEAGRKHKIRVNTISAEEVGDTAAFLASPLASAITGAVVYVDNGLNAMGVGVDSPVFAELDIPKDS
ncbi:NAD(P)-binding Rossmann-fold superfamily protein [Actinidia rufa]|uniref:NAD(P)-binding Rossmann-fold superfamily protein n=1 Tax=Actinidia rufa TaxID=165716 RepID=A0A7J0E281_9ERIC|nr:NAD(P)-binding Rossmann-fold superfamily protein [Actinidia rufa]